MNKTVYRLISFAVAIALAFGASSQVLASAAFDHRTQGQPAPLLDGRVYHVSSNGRDSNSGSATSPFKTFAKAVSMLAPGDTLQIQPGTYNESMRLTMSGTASAPITVIGNGALIDMQGADQAGIKISGNYLNVSGFEITGAEDAGIAMPGKYLTVKNNIVHGNAVQNGIGTCGTSTTGWGAAIKVGVGGENSLIEGNTVHNNCGEGIAVTRGVNITVKNNTVYDNFAPNIYIDNSPFSTVQSNLVYCTGAVVRRDGRRPTGIGLGEEFYEGWGAQLHDVTVIGNTVRDCGKGIGAFASEVDGTMTNVTITRNNVPSVETRAIALSTSPNRNVMISYNTICNSPYISDGAGITLLGNIVTGNCAFGSPGGPSPTSPPSLPTSTPTVPPVSNTATPVVSNTATPGSSYTSTPSAIPSASPTNPPAATFTSTPAPSATAAQQGPDPIFGSGFESGNFSGWSSNANGGGDLSVSPSAALVGSNGLQAVINDNNALSVSDGSPNAEPRYRARFYFDPNSIVMANGDAHIILRAYHGSKVALRVEFGFSASGYRVRAGLVSDGSAWSETDWFTISDAPHSIEVDWRASTGTNNGGLTLWIDGAQQADLTGVDNDTRRIDRAMLGALADLDGSTRGTYYFDAFESRRQTYIGP
jgi:parallel beta-helix repeat protein